ncbi:MAG TPA: FimV/HubP family polar landmark protein [Burkholderiales bacterium]
MDRVMEQPAYLGAGVIALILIGALAVRAVKRRRESKADSDDSGPAIVIAAPAAAAAYGGGAASSAPAAAASSDSDEVDPVKEAEIFLAYGRDAQAEELLKEALAANPNRQEVRVLLLQIYAKRKDAKSFETVAREVQQATGSSGPHWDQVVALGYQVDPSNPRYAAGQGSGGMVAAAAGAAAAAADNVDFNIGSDDAQSSTATDYDLGEGGSGLERTQVIDLSQSPGHDDTTVMEAPAAADIAFNVDVPAAEPSMQPEPAKSSSGLDFDIDLNSFNAPAAGESPAAAEPSGAGGLDFDMSGLSVDAPAASEPKAETASAPPEFDLSGISLDLGETTPRISPSGKDDHWYDVQTKFDLAKAYQEMGDKDGAREILKEVLQEGDGEQKAAAQAVLSSLDA